MMAATSIITLEGCFSRAVARHTLALDWRGWSRTSRPVEEL